MAIEFYDYYREDVIPGVYKGDVGILRSALEGGLDAKQMSKLLQSSLGADAYDTIKLQMIDMLLEYGADINAHSDGGYTPLAFAILNVNCNGMIIEGLIERGADVNGTCMDLRGQVDASPVHYATDEPYLMEKLVKNGANVNAIDRDGDTPIHWLARYGMGNDIPSDEYEGCCKRMVEFLVDSGADVSLRNNENQSPYDLAVQVGNEFIAECLSIEMAKRESNIMRSAVEDELRQSANPYTELYGDAIDVESVGQTAPHRKRKM